MSVIFSAPLVTPGVCKVRHCVWRLTCCVTYCVHVCRGLGSSIGDSSDGQFGSFVDGLGPGQIVGRQVLGSPCMGEVQLSIADRKGQLEVEVIRARALGAKPGAKVLPGQFSAHPRCFFLCPRGTRSLQ